ncbi:helix-turn-helix domain-containing protein [Caballeronia telluris]|uniref:Helix-turn-helix domain of resolvase n=1 Tax=Caballeronia telluris TaxID=326475 RepID=A0A158G1X7_9BURK|nr:helix-turn-helix domain-containing protein [Caballeronia telluris]SAL25877.1 Helix-turn-helix domain of resolvase [Caballeronia telluris]
MGRKSKLTDDQWEQIKRRLLEGESRRAIAKEFGISESSIREKVSAQVSEIKSVANQIVITERALSALPISAQITAQNLASKLRSISNHLASAADYGAATAHRLSALAHSEVEKIDDANPLSSAESLRGIAALTSLANESGKIALNLLNANKDRPLEADEPPAVTEAATAQDAAKIYQQMMMEK